MAEYVEPYRTQANEIRETTHYRLDDFELYKLAREFRKSMYRVVKELPLEEKYTLCTQMRDASISISNNIAEGHGRWHVKETIQFCRIARGSVEEVIDDLNICIDEGYYDEVECQRHKDSAYELIKRINGYIAYLRKR